MELNKTRRPMISISVSSIRMALRGNSIRSRLILRIRPEPGVSTQVSAFAQEPDCQERDPAPAGDDRHALK